MRTSTATTLNPFLNNPACTAEDSELVTRAKAGDQLEILLMRHLPWVFNLSVRMLHRRADAEDATQEILLKTIKALPGFRGEANFSTWVYRIAANHLLNIRKRKWAASDACARLPEPLQDCARFPIWARLTRARFPSHLR